MKEGALDGRRAPIIRNDRSTRITKPSAGPSALVQQINNDDKTITTKFQQHCENEQAVLAEALSYDADLLFQKQL